MRVQIHRFRYVLIGLLVSIIAYGVAIAWVYRHPPMDLSGLTLGYHEEYSLGIELWNKGRLPIRLTNVVIDGDAPLRKVIVVGEGSNAANRVVNGDLSVIQQVPVDGWVMQPSVMYKPPNYGLYLEWAAGAHLPSTVAVRYRYFGWPMTAQTRSPLDWDWMKRSAATPDRTKAGVAKTAEVCGPGPGDNAKMHTIVLADIDRLVQANRTNPKALTTSLIKAFGAAIEPVILVGDLDGDGLPDTVVGFNGCSVPALVYLAAGNAGPVMVPRNGDQIAWQFNESFRPDRIADVNGDGRMELVLEQTMAGGSASYIRLSVLQWKSTGFAELFTADLGTWRGENHWKVGEGTVSIQCRPLGPFEHKLSPNRQQTELYRWDAAEMRYVLADRSREPITTRLQAIAVAEELFGAGSYDDAATAFHQVARFQPTPNEPDWIAFAHLRIGQINVLTGHRTEALQALDQAAQGAAPIGPMAAHFRDAYAKADAPAAFISLWRWVQREAYSQPPAIRSEWPFLLDPHQVGARSALLAAYRQAGATPPGDLPAERTFTPPDCLHAHY